MSSNQTYQVKVYARRRKNHTNIQIKKGVRYTFSVDEKDKWVDMVVRCNADGFKSIGGLMRKQEHKRPLPKENWFTLVGEVNKKIFRIGTSLKHWEAPESGELICYVNDTVFWNNFGKVTLKIKELE